METYNDSLQNYKSPVLTTLVQAPVYLITQEFYSLAQHKNTEIARTIDDIRIPLYCLDEKLYLCADTLNNDVMTFVTVKQLQEKKLHSGADNTDENRYTLLYFESLKKAKEQLFDFPEEMLIGSKIEKATMEIQWE